LKSNIVSINYLFFEVKIWIFFRKNLNNSE